MSNNIKIIKSLSDKDPEYGFPLGEILCTTEKHLQEKLLELKNRGFKDLIVIPYIEEK